MCLWRFVTNVTYAYNSDKNKDDTKFSWYDPWGVPSTSIMSRMTLSSKSPVRNPQRPPSIIKRLTFELLLNHKMSCPGDIIILKPTWVFLYPSNIIVNLSKTIHKVNQNRPRYKPTHMKILKWNFQRWIIIIDFYQSNSLNHWVTTFLIESLHLDIWIHVKHDAILKILQNLIILYKCIVFSFIFELILCVYVLTSWGFA